jgi:hypothetical protein
MKTQIAIPITLPTEPPTMAPSEWFLEAAGVGIGDGGEVTFWLSDNEFGGGAAIVFRLHGKMDHSEFRNYADYPRAKCDREPNLPEDTEREL